jgi:hypothetical protein
MADKGPIQLYCEIHAACYNWLSELKAAGRFTATGVTGLAINLYLVATGFRPASSIVWDMDVDWRDSQKYLAPLGITLVRGAPEDHPKVMYFLGPGVPPSTKHHYLGDPFPDLTPRDYLGHLFPGLAPQEQMYTLRWSCLIGTGELTFLREPLGSYDELEDHVLVRNERERLQKALGPLGYEVTSTVVRARP